MNRFDLVVRGGEVVSGLSTDNGRLDVGIRDGAIVAIEPELEAGRVEVDARDRLVLPGGVDSHCHIEQFSSQGLMGADDFYSATVSAAAGGTTTVIPFAAQHRGDRIADILHEYHELAKKKSILDYSFHIIVTDPTEININEDLPNALESGHRSVKLFTSYDLMRVSDEQFLDVMDVCREHGGLAMVHAENGAVIKWMTKRLLDRGYIAPRYHAVSHPRLAEAEAVNRAVVLAALAGVPLVAVHISCGESLEMVRAARASGLDVTAETCPQYLFLTAENADKPGYEGARFIFSPPPRSSADQEVLWAGLADGTLDLFSSDHAPYRLDKSGKFSRSDTPSFAEIASGIPGLELRLPLLFSEGVGAGRIDLRRFVEVASTNAARRYGLFPKKGCIAIGSDADIAVWDPELRREVTAGMLHDSAGYTPYEGMSLKGWPTTVIQRGHILVEGGGLKAKAGQGTFLSRPPVPAPKTTVADTDPALIFGADVFS